jgi:hypothetical protein
LKIQFLESQSENFNNAQKDHFTKPTLQGFQTLAGFKQIKNLEIKEIQNTEQKASVLWIKLLCHWK